MERQILPSVHSLPDGTRVAVASSFWRRFLGWMFRKHPPSAAVLFPNCRAVHTCFMRFRLDLVALDRSGQVVAVKDNVPPWRMVVFPKNTWAVLELPAGLWATAPAWRVQASKS